MDSPCARIEWLDRMCHVRLPRALDRHPDLAERLEQTSPRWGTLGDLPAARSYRRCRPFRRSRRPSSQSSWGAARC